MKNVRASIIVTSYNRTALTISALESALFQMGGGIEIIVVDDGSDDFEELRRFCELRANIRYYWQRNEGQASALNQGYIKSHGELIFLLDSDDIFPEDYVERVEHIFRDDKSIQALYTSPIPFRGGAPRQLSLDDMRVLAKLPSGEVKSKILFSLVEPFVWTGTPTSGIVLTRNLAQRIFPLTENCLWNVGADQLICQRVNLSEQKVYRTNKVGFFYRVHPGNQYLNKLKRAEIMQHRRQALAASAADFVTGNELEIIKKQIYSLNEISLLEFLTYINAVIYINCTIWNKVMLGIRLLLTVRAVIIKGG